MAIVHYFYLKRWTQKSTHPTHNFKIISRDKTINVLFEPKQINFTNKRSKKYIKVRNNRNSKTKRQPERTNKLLQITTIHKKYPKKVLHNMV